MRPASIVAFLTSTALLLAACSSGSEASLTGGTGKSTKRMTRAMLSALSRRAAAPNRTIAVTAENWKFTPSGITVKKGENVTLLLEGRSGIHGFRVPGLGLNPTVTVGEKTSVKLPTDKAGTFEFFCSIPCGNGHKDMKGQIVIQE